ncbi:conserved hypothetical protein [Ixodes scapularis]|uniref:Uncharacterized protein n=1 Tax=Ixodes scapularis TaxID=6945 RepID=B7Q7S5_IXOSC|nr:conserved hypothetical protein [Ixodes scapularis]|eukprot:XP_002412205.1 conserved hypothetical protein [Ixodes scapularis]
MSICRTSPFSSRTKSLREKFASKRSYSESFKDPPASASAATSAAAAAGVPGAPGPAAGSGRLPSSPCVSLSSGGGSTDSSSGLVMAPSLQEYLPAYTAENAYCSALDINSQQGDPRFPWQRDVAVQCDLKTLSLSSSLTQASAATRSSSSEGRLGSLRKPTTFAAASRGGDFNSGTWSDPQAAASGTTSWTPTPPPRKSRHRVLPASLHEEGRGAGLYVPHHVQTLSNSPEGGSTPTFRGSQGATASPSRSSSSPSETTPPQTRRPSAAERRKMCFVRKETNSAPNSMDEDVPSPSSSVSAASTASSFLSGPGSVTSRASLASTAAAANAAPERPGYFNFESMQRLLDLSMNVPADRKSFFLEIPSQEERSTTHRSGLPASGEGNAQLGTPCQSSSFPLQV